MFKFGFTADDVKRIAWTAAMAFVGVFLTISTQVGSFKNFSDAKAAVLALVPAAIAAALSAIKNGVLSDSSALK